MCERRALLDPDMYKISEEDSQDEEVLSSLNKFSISSTGTQRRENGDVKMGTSSLGPRPNSNSSNNNSLESTKSRIVTNPRHHSSSSSSMMRHRNNIFKNPVGGINPSSISRKHQELMRVLGSSHSVEWPSSSSSSSSGSGSNSDSESTDVESSLVNLSNKHSGSASANISSKTQKSASPSTNSPHQNVFNNKQDFQPPRSQLTVLSSLTKSNSSSTSSSSRQKSSSRSIFQAQGSEHFLAPTSATNPSSASAKLTQSYENMETETDGEDDDEEIESSSGSESCSSCSRSRRHRDRQESDKKRHPHHHRYERSGVGGSAAASERHSHPRRKKTGSGSSYSSESYSSSSANEEDPELEESQDDYEDDGEDYDRDDGDDDDFQLITESEIEFTTNEEGNVLLLETRMQTEGDSTRSPMPSPNISSGFHGSHPQQIPISAQQQRSEIQQDGSIPLTYFDQNNVNSVQISEKSKKSKITKGGISRFLKRGSGSKSHEQNARHKTSLLSKSSSASSSMKKSKGKGSGVTAERSVPAPGKVFRFKDEHEGEIRHVELSIGSWNRYNLGRRATLSETLLGIIPGRFSSPPALSGTSHHNNHSQNGSVGLGPPTSNFLAATSSSQSRTSKWEQEDDRIMVAGFIPDGVAVRNRHIKIGDWLQSIDDRPVNFGNIDAVLTAAVQKEHERQECNTDSSSGAATNTESQLTVKLALQRVAGCTITEPEKPPRKSLYQDVESGGRSEQDENIRSILPPSSTADELTPELLSNLAVLYISTVANSPSSNSPTKERTKDVVFSWPKDTESNKVKALAASQGMFSTLFRLLRDVTGSYPIMSRVMINDVPMDVSYWSDNGGKSLLLLATATSVSNLSSGAIHLNSGGSTETKKQMTREEMNCGGAPVSHRIMHRLKNAITFKYGSLTRAFSTTNEIEMARYLSNTLAGLIDVSEDFLFMEVPTTSLNLPSHIQYPLDELLYVFETSDFYLQEVANRSKSEDSHFHCLGSCLMYKGGVVVSHLESDLASQFHGWWRIQLSKWARHRVALSSCWEPVKRLVIWQKAFLTPTPDLQSTTQPYIPQSPTPCYAALVGIDYFLLGFVLEPVVPVQMKPDILWIKKALNTLMRLVQRELGTQLETWVNHLEDDFVELLPPKEMSQSSSTNKSRVGSVGSSGKKGRGVSTGSPSGTTTNSILKNSESVIGGTMGSSGGGVSGSPGGSASGASAGSIFSSSGLKNLISGQSGVIGTKNNPINPTSPGNNLDEDVIMGLNASVSHLNALGFFTETTKNDGSNLNLNNAPPGESDVDEDEIDETTTGTGSDASSFKWNGDVSERLGTGGVEDQVKTISVTKGNTLFNFVQIEYGRGIMLTSKEGARDGPYSVILHNFRQSASITHNILHRAVNARQRLGDQESDKKWVSKALAPICEHGTLFQCQVAEVRDSSKKKRRSHLVTYWVVGRIYPDQREGYVCYQDTPMSQNIIEIAFKLAHNIT